MSGNNEEYIASEEEDAEEEKPQEQAFSAAAARKFSRMMGALSKLITSTDTSKPRMKKAIKNITKNVEPDETQFAELDELGLEESLPVPQMDEYVITVPAHDPLHTVSGQLPNGEGVNHVQVATLVDGVAGEWQDVDDYDEGGDFSHELGPGKYVFSNLNENDGRSGMSPTVEIKTELYFAPGSGESDEEEPQSAPEFVMEGFVMTVNENEYPFGEVVQTSSATPVVFNIPVFDANGDDVTVSMSFNGDDHGCTFDQDEKVVVLDDEGNGVVQFIMTPEILNTGTVKVQVEISDVSDGLNVEEVDAWIQ